MAAQLKEAGRSSSVQFVHKKAFARIVEACENPPKASPALKDLIAKGRALRGK